jgi:hypothetical protein
VSRGKDEAGKMVEFRNQPHHLPTFFDGIGVKVLAFKEVAEFAQRQAAPYLRVIWSATTCSIKLSKT